jgi:predicted RNase H-like nuclease
MSVIVTGIDGCRSGWVAVTLCFAAGAGVRVRTASTLDGLGIEGIAGIDMPLGLLAEGWRTADALARRALGARGASVFAIPPRPVWAAPDYATANRRCRDLTGRGMSAQAWGLRGKLLEADRFRRRSADAMYEVHPELSFAGLAGAPLEQSKHRAPGRARRRALLEGAGIVLPERVPGAAEDDLLDAAAVAWSARRIATGTARVLPDPPAQRSDDGYDIAIRY